jgi:hypothetical protein
MRPAPPSGRARAAPRGRAPLPTRPRWLTASRLEVHLRITSATAEGLTSRRSEFGSRNRRGLSERRAQGVDRMRRVRHHLGGGHARSWRSRLTRPSVAAGWRSDLDLVCLDAYLVNRHAFLGRGPLPPARDGAPSSSRLCCMWVDMQRSVRGFRRWAPDASALVSVVCLPDGTWRRSSTRREGRGVVQAARTRPRHRRATGHWVSERAASRGLRSGRRLRCRAR